MNQIQNNGENKVDTLNGFGFVVIVNQQIASFELCFTNHECEMMKMGPMRVQARESSLYKTQIHINAIRVNLLLVRLHESETVVYQFDRNKSVWLEWKVRPKPKIT